MRTDNLIAALATDLPVATTEGIAHAVLDWLDGMSIGLRPRS